MPAPREVACLGLLPKMSLAGASPVDVDGSGLLLQRLLASPATLEVTGSYMLLRRLMVSACSRGECSLGPAPAESTLAWPGPKEFSDVDLGPAVAEVPHSDPRRLMPRACSRRSRSLRLRFYLCYPLLTFLCLSAQHIHW